MLLTPPTTLLTVPLMAPVVPPVLPPPGSWTSGGARGLDRWAGELASRRRSRTAAAADAVPGSAAGAGRAAATAAAAAAVAAPPRPGRAGRDRPAGERQDRVVQACWRAAGPRRARRSGPLVTAESPPATPEKLVTEADRRGDGDRNGKEHRSGQSARHDPAAPHASNPLPMTIPSRRSVRERRGSAKKMRFNPSLTARLRIGFLVLFALLLRRLPARRRAALPDPGQLRGRHHPLLPARARERAAALGLHPRAGRRPARDRPAAAQPGRAQPGGRQLLRRRRSSARRT